MREADWEEAQRLNDMLGARDRELSERFRLARALQSADTAVHRAALDELRGLPAQPQRIMANLMSLAGDMPLVRTAASLAIESAPDPSAALTARMYATRAEIASGRWSRARVHMDAMAQIAPQSGEIYLAGYAAMPFMPVPEEEMRDIRARVEHWDSIPPANADEYSSQQLWAHRRLYVLGVLSARLRELEEAEAYALRLEELDAPAAWAAAAPGFASSLRARIALEREDWKGAWKILEANVHHGAPELGNFGAAPMEMDRWIRAEVLFRLGRDREAWPRLENLLGMFQYEEAYLAPRHLRLAQIHDRAGRREQALEHYRAFLALWGDADPPLQPMVGEARVRLSALER